VRGEAGVLPSPLLHRSPPMWGLRASDRARRPSGRDKVVDAARATVARELQGRWPRCGQMGLAVQRAAG
jgi:hypothetical protein